jgi:hypothetical protein
MARLNSADELEALRRQQIELAKRIKEVELKTREKEKADNERREQIAGRAVLAYLATNPHSDTAKAIVGILETGILKAADRALFFGAPEKPAAKAAPPNKTETNAAPLAEGGAAPIKRQDELLSEISSALTTP